MGANSPRTRSPSGVGKSSSEGRHHPVNIIEVMNTQLHFKVRGTMRNLHPTTMPLWSLVKGVRENRALAELTAQGRALPKEQFKDWKPKNLMSIYFAVRYRDAEGRADRVTVFVE